MKRTIKFIIFYAILGLSLGVYYRELPKLMNYEGVTMLSVVHTHAFTLGMMMSMILLILDYEFKMSEEAGYNKAFIIYQAGVLWTISLMIIHGTMDVLLIPSNAMIAGIAGLGHILIAIGLLMILFKLKKKVEKVTK